MFHSRTWAANLYINDQSELLGHVLIVRIRNHPRQVRLIDDLCFKNVCTCISYFELHSRQWHVLVETYWFEYSGILLFQHVKIQAEPELSWSTVRRFMLVPARVSFPDHTSSRNKNPNVSSATLRSTLCVYRYLIELCPVLVFHVFCLFNNSPWPWLLNLRLLTELKAWRGGNKTKLLTTLLLYYSTI